MLNLKWLPVSAATLFLASFCLSSIAQVVVVPLGSDGSPLKNVVTVGKANGDFNHPVAAMQSITDASESNPYLLYIGPGVYTMTEPLELKEYVDVVGSGPNITMLVGDYGDANDESSSIVSIKEVHNANLRDLSIKNTGGGATYTFGIYTFGFGSDEDEIIRPTIENVTIDVVGSSGGTRGIYIDQYSELTLKSIRINATDDTGFSTGIFNAGYLQTISDSVINARGTCNCQRSGIANNNGGSFVRVSNSTISAVGGNSAEAILAFNGAYVSHSILEGGTNGTARCSFSFLPDRTALDGFCQPPPP